MKKFVYALITYTDANGDKKIIETVTPEASDYKTPLPPNGELKASDNGNLIEGVKRIVQEQIGITLIDTEYTKPLATITDRNGEHLYILFYLGKKDQQAEINLKKSLSAQGGINEHFGAVHTYNLTQEKADPAAEIILSKNAEGKYQNNHQLISQAFNGNARTLSQKPINKCLAKIYKQIQDGNTQFTEYGYDDEKNLVILSSNSDSTKSFLDYCKEPKFDNQYNITELKNKNNTVIGRRIEVAENTAPNTDAQNLADVLVYADKLVCAKPNENSINVMAKLVQQRFQDEKNKDILVTGKPDEIAALAKKCPNVNIYIKGADGKPVLYTAIASTLQPNLIEPPASYQAIPTIANLEEEDEGDENVAYSDTTTIPIVPFKG